MNPITEGESSLAYLIWDYNFHIEYHLVQLLEGYVIESRMEQCLELLLKPFINK